jgi:hypothetical protein
MTQVRVFIIFLLACFVLAACKSSATTGNSPANTAANVTANANSANMVATTAPQISNSAMPTNGSPLMQNGKFDDLRKNGANGPIDPKAAAKGNARPAPDNSEFSSSLTDIGRELRTFHNHPQIIKAEKLIMPKSQIIKIYLKGGRVVEVPGEKIPNMLTALAIDFLVAAGVQPLQPKTVAGDAKPKAKQ